MGPFNRVEAVRLVVARGGRYTLHISLCEMGLHRYSIFLRSPLITDTMVGVVGDDFFYGLLCSCLHKWHVDVPHTSELMHRCFAVEWLD